MIDGSHLVVIMFFLVAYCLAAQVVAIWAIKRVNWYASIQPFPIGFDYEASLTRHNYLNALYNRQGKFVYVLRDVSVTGYYKIGRSSSLERRLFDFGVRLPMEVHLVHVIPHENEIWLEATLHRLFADKRVSGEWFRLGDLEVDYLTTSPLLNGGMF